jgi:hypothetical protein
MKENADFSDLLILVNAARVSSRYRFLEHVDRCESPLYDYGLSAAVSHGAGVGETLVTTTGLQPRPCHMPASRNLTRISNVTPDVIAIDEADGSRLTLAKIRTGEQNDKVRAVRSA